MVKEYVIVSLLILGLLLVSGVNSCIQEAITCDKPYLKVGIECCLDQNNNSVCDKDEQTSQQGAPSTEKEIVTPSCTPDWQCASWAPTTCPASEIQTKTCTDLNNCGTTANKPAESQTCTYTPACTENWQCNSWSECSSLGKQTRTCTDTNNCNVLINKPTETQSCTAPCTPDWQCASWSTCSSSGIQTRSCTDRNTCGILENKPIESQSCTPPVKSATLSIDKIQITAANLYPTRVIVTNTGNTEICPKFDLYVYKSSTEVCSGSALLPFDCVGGGNTKTDEITMLGCMFEEDGTYTLKVDLLNSDYSKLDSKTKDFVVDYWP